MQMRVWVPFVMAVCGYLVFTAFDWMWLRSLIGQGVGFLLKLWGPPVMVRGTFVSTPSVNCEITRDCTYADMLCFITPLLLRRRAVGVECLRVLSWWVGLLLVNVVRLAIACDLHEMGISWFSAHNVPDYLIRSLVMLVVFVRWLQFLRQKQVSIENRAPNRNDRLNGD
jgi:hypothetical protein